MILLLRAHNTITYFLSKPNKPEQIFSSTEIELSCYYCTAYRTYHFLLLQNNRQKDREENQLKETVNRGARSRSNNDDKRNFKAVVKNNKLHRFAIKTGYYWEKLIYS